MGNQLGPCDRRPAGLCSPLVRSSSAGKAPEGWRSPARTRFPIQTALVRRAPRFQDDLHQAADALHALQSDSAPVCLAESMQKETTNEHQWTRIRFSESQAGGQIPGHCLVNAGAASQMPMPSPSLFVFIRVHSWLNSMVPVYRAYPPGCQREFPRVQTAPGCDSKRVRRWGRSRCD